MYLLYEGSLWLIVGGVLVALALAFAAMVSRRMFFLWGALAVGLFIVAGIVIDRAVVTESEEVELALNRLAQAIESNDKERVLALFDPSCEARARAALAMSAASKYTITSARAVDPKVEVDDTLPVHEARVRFTAQVNVKDPQQLILYEHYRKRFVVTMVKRDGQWLLTDYEVGDVRGGATEKAAY